MSSGQPNRPWEQRGVVMGMGRPPLDGETMDRIARLGMSPRQQELNRLWAYYRCQQYEARSTDWDGTKHSDPLDHESIATAGFIPPGFYDAGRQALPVKFRRPNAPYHLVKVVVDRFTELLFSERMHPQLRVEGDPDTEDYVSAIAEAGRLWQHAMQARTFGGGMGTAIIGFQFIAGLPVFEVHDARWCLPQFSDRRTFTLASIEERYQFPVEVKDPETGLFTEVAFWYRRVIDESSDTVFEPEPVGDGIEPIWQIAQQVVHNFGFCPVKWAQNLPVLDSVDGDPDCAGIFDLTETIDALLSQANRGTIANCDPTVHIATAKKVPTVLKGSDNAIVTEPEGSVAYLEINGTGPKAARELAMELRQYALEVAQCVIERTSDGDAAKTATEVTRNYASMHGKADLLREQYGEKLIKPLLEMVLRAAAMVSGPVMNVDGTPATNDAGQQLKGGLLLPEKVTRGEDGKPARVARKLGDGGVLKLQWPQYVQPSVTDMETATRAAAGAKAAGLIDIEHAAKIVAPYYGVEDVTAMMENILKARAALTAGDAQGAADAIGSAMGTKPFQRGIEVPASPDAKGNKFFQYEIEGGLVTINEVRASKGLGPIEDGELTLPQYKAKYMTTTASAAVVSSPTTAAELLGIGPPGGAQP